MSGASPLYYNTLSGPPAWRDLTAPGDFKLTKYFNGMAIGVGAAVSSGTRLSVAGIRSNGRNFLGRSEYVGVRLRQRHDRISPTNGIVNAPRNTLDTWPA
jgi:hypothetical protein